MLKAKWEMGSTLILLQLLVLFLGADDVTGVAPPSRTLLAHYSLT